MDSDLIEALQVEGAILITFSGEPCLDISQQIDQIDPNAPVVYPIILPYCLAVILSKTGQPLRYYVTQKLLPTSRKTLEKLLVAWKSVSNRARSLVPRNL